MVEGNPLKNNLYWSGLNLMSTKKSFLTVINKNEPK